MDDDSLSYDPASTTSGVLSMFAGLVGVLLVMASVISEPKSLLGLIIGLLTFWLAFFLRFIHLVYKRPLY